jgi:hypothetical protein
MKLTTAAKGSTTLVTADNKSPVIVADSAGLPGIIYNSYDIATKTIAPGDSTLFGIVSGGNIAVNNKWMKQWSGGATSTGKRIGMQDALAYAEGITSNKYNSLLHVNASMIATEKDTSGMFVGGMGVNANGATLSIKIPNTSYYCLYVTGSVAFRSYRAHAKSGFGTYQNTYVSDGRLPHGVTFPNQPLVFDANGLLVLDMQDWADSVRQY